MQRTSPGRRKLYIFFAFAASEDVQRVFRTSEVEYFIGLFFAGYATGGFHDECVWLIVFSFVGTNREKR